MIDFLIDLRKGPVIMLKKLTCLALLASAAFAFPAHAEKGDFLVRARAILIAPDDSSTGIMPTFPNERVGLKSTVVPELDFAYMVTKRVGLELVLTTTKRKVSGQTGTTGAIGTLASIKLLPPTLTAQYHFIPDGKVRPYVGAGFNYNLFYDETASQGLVNAVGTTRVKLGNKVGKALQAGVDIDLTKDVFLNLDVKYIDFSTTARLTTTAIGVQSVRVKVNPFIVGVGLGTRF
jgi:outer membrane protein